MTRVLGTLALALSPLYVLLMVRLGGLPIRSVTLAFASFLMGTLLELLRLTKSLRDTAGMVTVAFLFSLANFLPYRSDRDYSLQRHLDNWPFGFVLLLLLFMAIGYSKRLTPKLGEGSTMLYSMAFFYWMLDRQVSQSGPLFLVVIAALPLIHAIFHAATDRPLSRGTRLALSLWSAVVMAALAIRYAVTVLRFGSIEPHLEKADFLGATRIFIEFLLLGAAGATLMQNLMMLLGYVPQRNSSVKQYVKQVRELCATHVERFSADQVPRGQAWAAMTLAVVVLVANWRFRAVSTGFMTWFLVAGVPWILAGWTWWRARRFTGLGR